MIEEIIKIFFIFYFISYNTINLILIIIAFYEVKFGFYHSLIHEFGANIINPVQHGVSILVPAYNEEKNIVESIHSLLRLDYPQLEIIIINDGSTDGTLRRVKRHFGFEKSDIVPKTHLGTAKVLGVYALKEKTLNHFQRILLLDKENGGKADALNVGINYASLPYVCSMDADSIMEKDSISKLMRMFSVKKRPVIAIGGQVGIVNGCKLKEGEIVRYELPQKVITQIQLTEYLRSFVAGRTALANLNSLLILSGVFSIFEKEAVIKIGGYLTKFMDLDIAKKYVGKPQSTVCEDMEIIVRLHRYIQEEKINGEISFYPNPIAWTEAPERWTDLGKQRDRWYRGLAESLMIHKRMLLNPGYRQIGLFAMPYQFFFEFLGPLIEFLGYVCLPVVFFFGSDFLVYLKWFLAASILYGVFISCFSVIFGIFLEEENTKYSQKEHFLIENEFRKVLRILLLAMASNIFYRQFILLWQIRGFYGFLRKKESWEKMERRGL
ncbi:MAG: glycosyltransferase family 2 protein [Deltaproteobacteria bacterium]|nr:glycosyltransferase family 2 protein [Deltaproteobacteria bacterium]